MSDTATLPPPTERKCSIEEVFDASFIELLPHKFVANLSKLETYRGGRHE